MRLIVSIIGVLALVAALAFTGLMIFTDLPLTNILEAKYLSSQMQMATAVKACAFYLLTLVCVSVEQRRD